MKNKDITKRNRNASQRQRGHSLTVCNSAQPATPHSLQNPKWPPGGPKMANGVWKCVYPLVFGCSRQLLLNKILIRALLL